MRRLSPIAPIVALACLAGAVPAGADVYDDYRRDGQIDPCRYSDGQLRRGLNGLPPDIKQYAPGLADQLSAGREGCGVGGRPGAGETRQFEAVSPVGPQEPPKPDVPTPPSPKPGARQRLAGVSAPQITTAATGADAPGWLLPLLLVLLGAGGAAAFARLGGVSADGLVRPLRASFGEASGRTSDAFAQLLDSVRTGRS